MNNLSDMVRTELAMAGFTECMNWSLLSQKERLLNGQMDRWLLVGRGEHAWPVVNVFNSALMRFNK